jgi:hypothetical protein
LARWSLLSGAEHLVFDVVEHADRKMRSGLKPAVLLHVMVRHGDAVIPLIGRPGA